MRRIYGALGGIAAVALTLTGCVGAGPGDASPDDNDDSPAMWTGDDRQERLVSCAEEEGSFLLYTQLIVDQAVVPLLDAFQKEYPFLDVDYLRNDGGSLVQRLINEGQANQVVADVYEGTLAGGAAVAAGVAQPFTTPALESYPEEFLDPDNMYAPTLHYYDVFGYNTDTVPESEVPETLDDLLAPEWGGGAVAFGSDPGNGGPLLISTLRDAWGDEKAEEWLAKFAEQKPVDAGSTARAMTDTVIAGEHKGALPILAHHAPISQREGAPIGTASLDPVPSQLSTAILVAGAPHPCAGMLFLDFILGDKGAKVLTDANYIPVNPDAELPEDVRAVIPPDDKAHFMSPARLEELRADSVDLFREYFQ